MNTSWGDQSHYTPSCNRAHHERRKVSVQNGLVNTYAARLNSMKIYNSTVFPCAATKKCFRISQFDGATRPFVPTPMCMKSALTLGLSTFQLDSGMLWRPLEDLPHHTTPHHTTPHHTTNPFTFRDATSSEECVLQLTLKPDGVIRRVSTWVS